ncbi:MAG: hypothetical protein HY791_23200 [Deltaproteobacteria bacterium]|nr:hypothetical protein [Deltaproteobacteria bacterium]
MSLAGPTLIKLARESFRGASPMVITERDLPDLRERIRALVEPIDWVTWDTRTGIHGREYFATFSIRDPDEASWRTEAILLSRAKEHLQLKVGFDVTALVSDLDEIRTFTREFKSRLERGRALRIKRQKIRNLKYEGVLAEIKRAAVLDEFDFITEILPHHVNLYVGLSGDRCLLIRIPFGSVQQTLSKIRPTIAKVRQLHADGVSFQITGTRSWRGMSSFSHKDLPRVEEDDDGDSA